MANRRVTLHPLHAMRGAADSFIAFAANDGPGGHVMVRTALAISLALLVPFSLAPAFAAEAPSTSAWTPADSLPPMGDALMQDPMLADERATSAADALVSAGAGLAATWAATLDEVHGVRLDVPAVAPGPLAVELARAHAIAGTPLSPMARLRLAASVASVPPTLAAPLATLVAGANAAETARGDLLAGLEAADLAVLVPHASAGRAYDAGAADRLSLVGNADPSDLLAAEAALAGLDERAAFTAHAILARAVDDAVAQLAAARAAGIAPFTLGTPYGDVHVAGEGADVHTRERFVTIDLGGDDAWLNSAGGVSADVLGLLAMPAPPQPTDPGFAAWVETAYGFVHRAHNASIAIDLGGNDAYTAAFGAQGFGAFGGFGALVDVAGDDRYTGGRFTQGAGLILGAGFLADLGGSDAYRVDRQGQGYGHDLGGGFLLDAGGADTYDAFVLAQGTGYSFNVAGVLVDLAGNDRYACSGVLDFAESIIPVNAPRPGSICQAAGFGGTGILVEATGDDTYATASSFQSMSLIGVSLLVDGDGRDAYFGHEWSHANGVLGAAVLVDGGGDDLYQSRQVEPAPWLDVYIGSNAMGYLGVGVLTDGAGNDVYESTPRKDLWLVQYGCGAGCAWGAGAAVLTDLDGNDRYESEMGQGGARLGSAVLLDAAGDDRYALTLGGTWGQGFADTGVLSVIVGLAPAECYYGVLWDGDGLDAYNNPVTTFGVRGDDTYWGQNDFGRGIDGARTGTVAYATSAQFQADLSKIVATHGCETVSGPALFAACFLLGDPAPVC